MSFAGTSLYRLPLGAVPVKKPPSVVTSDQPFLILESPEAFPLVGLLGNRFQSCSCEACEETPLQWLPVISPILILEPPPEAFPLV